MEWGKQDELSFIRRLGSHALMAYCASGLSAHDWRLKCLRGYLQAIEENPPRRWGLKLDTTKLRGVVSHELSHALLK